MLLIRKNRVLNYLHSRFLLHERPAIYRNWDGNIGGGDLTGLTLALRRRLGGEGPAIGLQPTVVLLDVGSHLLVLLLPLQGLAGIHLLRGPGGKSDYHKK